MRAGLARAFGLITTNSLRQAFNRRVFEAQLQAKPPLHLVFAIADHPWVDSADGAAARIAITVARARQGQGQLLRVVDERADEDGEARVSLQEAIGLIHADLRVGVNVSGTERLQANQRLSNTGYILGGRGFVLRTAEAKRLGEAPNSAHLLFPLFNGEDILGRVRNCWVIDAYGTDSESLRARAPELWQILRDRVYPDRLVNPDPRARGNWWLFRRSNEQLRAATAGLSRFFVTPETAKHRVFTFLGGYSRPEHRLVVVSSSDALHFGVLSSRVHIAWSLSTGGTLEDRHVYNKSLCFEPFPFPDLTDQLDLAAQIATLAEELDAHRKRQQAAYATLTLTDMYNVLDALRLGRALTTKERVTHANGLVSVLAELHDRLDALVLQAYGWADLAPALVGQPGGTLPWPEKPAAQAAAEEALLLRLVALNAERAAEEARGLVRWLRPEFQGPALRHGPAQPVATQDEMDLGIDVTGDDATAPPPTKKGRQPGPTADVVAAPSRRPWPNTLPEQMRGVAGLLASAPRPIAIESIASAFTGRGPWKRRLPQILQALEALGRARGVNGLWAAG